MTMTMTKLLPILLVVLFLVGCGTVDIPWMEDRADSLAGDIEAAKAEVAALEKERAEAIEKLKANPEDAVAAATVEATTVAIAKAAPVIAKSENTLAIVRKRIEEMKRSDGVVLKGIEDAARVVPGYGPLIVMGIGLVASVLRSRANRKAGQDLARTVMPLIKASSEGEKDILTDTQSPIVKAIVREARGKKKTPIL